MAAEETPGVRNKGLLVVAAVLGVVVVIIYNVHIQNVRDASKGQTVALLQYARDLEQGETIVRKDIELVQVPKESVLPLGNVVPKKELDFAVGSDVNQNVKKGQWVLWGHVTEGGPRGSTLQPQKGYIGLSIEVDPKTVPGQLLWVGSRVNIDAMLPTRGRAPSAQRVIEAVRILAVGGRVYTQEAGSSGRRAASTYRSVTIEVKKDVSLQLQNVLSHKSGSVTLELRNSQEPLPSGAGTISKALDNLAKAAFPKSEASPYP